MKPLKYFSFFIFSTFFYSTGFCQNWFPVGGGMSFFTPDTCVMSLHTDTASGFLYAGGQFSMAGATSAKNIARWNGTTWAALGLGIDSAEQFAVPTVYAITKYNGDIYAAGYFYKAGSTPANYIARWDGTNWYPLGSGLSGGVLGLEGARGLSVYNGELYVGGNFTTAGGNSVGGCIAKWNGTGWSQVGAGIGFNGFYVNALAVYNGELYAGGMFTTVDGMPAKYIAKWNGSNWSAADSISSVVNALCVYNGELYAGGDFGSPGIRICKWNGTDWFPVGTGMDDRVSSLCVYNNELYSGGIFTNAGGNSANYIAKWNGSAWSAVGLGMCCPITAFPSVDALAVYSNQIYAGGWFFQAGTNTCYKIATWPSPVGIEDYNNELDNLIIFPNPSNGVFDIESSLEIIYLNIFNVLGENIFEYKQPSRTISIDISDSPIGVYLVNFETEQGVIRKTIIISK